MFKKTDTSKILNHLKITIFPISLLIISIIVYWRWVFLNEIFTHGDWLFWYDTSISDFFNIPQIWNNYSFGYVDFNLSSSLIYLLLGLLQQFSSYKFNIKLVYFFPVVFALPIGTYLLALKILKNKIASFTATLIFIFNTYFLIGVTGHLTLMAAYSFTPFLIKSYFDFSNDPKLKNVIFLSLISFLIISFEARAAYMAFLLLLIYFLFTILDSKIQIKIKIKYLLLNCFYAILLILLNFFWIIPLIFTGKLYNNEIFSRGLFGDQYLNISNALTTYHPFWSYKGITIFEVQNIPFYYYFYPFLMFFGYYLNRSQKNIKFFLFITVFGIFLTKQSSEPFGFVYKFLYENFPGFNAFREASKFFYISSLGYSILIGYLVAYLVCLKQKIYNFIGLLIVLFVTIVTFTNTAMFINGSVGSLFVSRSIPDEYIQLANQIYNQNSYFRTLWIPVDSRWSYFDNKNPKISMNNLESLFLDSLKYAGPNQDKTLYLLQQEYSQDLINSLNIKYIIVPARDHNNDDDFWIYYGGLRNPNIREYYDTELSKIPWLQKLHNYRDLYVYENISFKDLINISDKNLEYNWQKIDNSTYLVNIDRYNGNQFYIEFSQSYHPDWGLSVYDNSNLLIYKSDESVVKPEKGIYGTNNFKLDSSKICKTLCPDKISLILHFKPQYYLNLSLTVSITTLVSLIILYLIIFNKNKGLK